MSALGCETRIIRAPNHMGDVIMAVRALARDGADVLIVRRLAPLLEMAGLRAHIRTFDRGARGWLRGVMELRRARYREGVLLTPSFSSAWLLRWGGVRRLTGTEGDGRGPLLTRAIPREDLRGMHRADQYRMLLGQGRGGATGPPVLTPRAEDLGAWRGRLGEDRLVALFPGANAPARRWPASRFRDLASALTSEGMHVVVLGGEAETELAAQVASCHPGCTDLGGATDLWGLAAVLALCHLVVTNDTGPMHLAGAVGTRTVTLWGPSDPAEVGLPSGEHAGVRGPPLPCRPCFKNRCPRSGEGTLSPRAHEECMRTITVAQVLDTTMKVLDEEAA